MAIIPLFLTKIFVRSIDATYGLRGFAEVGRSISQAVGPTFAKREILSDLDPINRFHSRMYLDGVVVRV